MNWWVNQKKIQQENLNRLKKKLQTLKQKTNKMPVDELILKPCPTAGAGVHKWIYHVVCRMVDAQIGDADILRYCERNCSRVLQPREVENALISRRGMLQRGTVKSTNWPRPNAAEVKRLVKENPKTVKGLYETSPMPLDKYDAESIVDYLFPENPLLCCGVSSKTFATRPREEWRGKLDKLQLIVPSPMNALYGKTQAGRESMHTLENTGPRKYLVTEFDEGAFDDHASLLWQLNSLITPLICAVMSGNKSLHGWFLVENWSETRLTNFLQRAACLGADTATFTKSQFVRIPDGTRASGVKQTTVYLSDLLL